MKSIMALSLFLSLGSSMASDVQTYKGSECQNGLTLTGVTNLETEGLLPCTRFLTHEGPDTIITCSGADPKVLDLIKISYSGTRLGFDLTSCYSIMDNRLQIQPFGKMGGTIVGGSVVIVQGVSFGNRAGSSDDAFANLFKNIGRCTIDGVDRPASYMSINGVEYINGVRQGSGGGQGGSDSSGESYDISGLKIEVNLPQTLYEINANGSSDVQFEGPLVNLKKVSTSCSGNISLDEVSLPREGLNVETGSSGDISIDKVHGPGNVEFETQGSGKIDVATADKIDSLSARTSSSGDISVSSVGVSGATTLQTSGSGTITMDGLSTAILKATTSSSGDISVSGVGVTGSTTLRTGGSGEIKIKSGSVNDLEATTSSSGDITCRAEIKGKLTYRVNGSGDIKTTQPKGGAPTGRSTSSGKFKII